jgi:hypothetical protein
LVGDDEARRASNVFNGYERVSTQRRNFRFVAAAWTANDIANRLVRAIVVIAVNARVAVVVGSVIALLDSSAASCGGYALVLTHWSVDDLLAGVTCGAWPISTIRRARTFEAKVRLTAASVVISTAWSADEVGLALAGGTTTVARERVSVVAALTLLKLAVSTNGAGSEVFLDVWTRVLPEDIGHRVRLGGIRLGILRRGHIRFRI